MNAIKAFPGYECHLAFPQINAEYAFGIRPNQRRMRAWHSAGMNACRRSPPTEEGMLGFAGSTQLILIMFGDMHTKCEKLRKIIELCEKLRKLCKFKLIFSGN